MRYVQARPLAVMCVAAPEDTALLAQWEAHLQSLVQARLLSCWSERHLSAGTDREAKRRAQLEQADIILLLLSADFFDSLDCLTQMEVALERSHRDAVRVIPLLLRSVAWQESPLSNLSPWLSNGKPIMRWEDQDEAWQTCVQELRRLLGRRVTETFASERSATTIDADWDRMLRRLKRAYKDLLDQSLHGIAWVELDLAARPDLVSNITNLLFRLPQGGERLLPTGTSLLNAYDEADGELLILGTPGAGKSTLMLNLAQQLVERTLSDAQHPLPVILRLSSWAVGQPDLTEWMTEQISRTYDVPHLLSERWVRQGCMLPLLDGLDEMEEAARPSCIAAINRYHRTHLLPLVVCSRQAEYEGAAKCERLALQSAVIVQPLSDEQIEDYLQAAGSSFAGVQTALHQQQALWELAATPLMLSVLLLTYRDASTKDIPQQETDLERQVWTDYVVRQVQEKGNGIQFPLEHTRAWLGWLAQQMHTHKQTILYAEYLQTDWLLKTQQSTATWFATSIPSIVIGACTSVLVFLFMNTTINGIILLQMGVLGGFVGGYLSPSAASGSAERERSLSARTTRYRRNALFLGFLLIMCMSLPLSQDCFLRDRLLDASFMGLGGLLSGLAFQIFLDCLPAQQVIVLSASPHRRGRLATWMNMIGSPGVWRAAAVLGMGFGLSYGLSVGLFTGSSSIGMAEKLSLGMGFGALAEPLSGLPPGLFSGLFSGLSVSVSVVLVRLIFDTSLRTLRLSERIHWSWRSFFRSEHLQATMIVTILVSLCSGLIYGLTYLLEGLRTDLEPSQHISLPESLGDSLLSGLSIGLRSG